MRILLFLFLSSCSSPLLLSSNPRDNNIRKVEVAQVIDGDTVTVKLYHSKNLIVIQKIRLKDVRAFEINTPKGKEDRDFLIKLLEQYKEASVLLFNRFTYDRQEGVLYVDGKNINNTLKEREQGGR